ncbi:hypothetical protein ACFL15_00705, partial [Patescibacteria group bacterium]
APIFMIFAALFINEIIVFLSKFLRSKKLLFCIIVLISVSCFTTLRNAVINVYYYTKPWNYEVLKSWEKKNLPKNSIVAAKSFDPLIGDESIVRSEFEFLGNYSLAEHRDAGADYAIVNMDWTSNYFYSWMHFGFDKIELLKEKPLQQMRETFPGIVIEELLRYNIYSISKPWQAPEPALYVNKLFSWPNSGMQRILEENFHISPTNWNQILTSNGEESYMHDSASGNSSKGSILFTAKTSDLSSIEYSTSAISVKPGHLYKVQVFIKSEKMLSSKERDGYVRIDFYSDESMTSNSRIYSTVSSRLFGTNDWTKKEAIETAPDDAKYMKVSLQVFSNTSSSFWFDDVVIEESLEKLDDPRKKYPYIQDIIDFDLLYPNSHANL